MALNYLKRTFSLAVYHLCVIVIVSDNYRLRTICLQVVLSSERKCRRTTWAVWSARRRVAMISMAFFKAGDGQHHRHRADRREPRDG